MLGVMEGKKDSIVSYLRHIWGTPLYDLEINTYREEGRKDVLAKWSKVQQANAKKIKTMEEATLLYPYSPEIYYNLSLLYSENGDKGKAQENILKAKQIDPSIR